MTHFGILCPNTTGHLNPMTAMGHELQIRGHHVTLFGVLDSQSKAVASGLGFCAIGEDEYPFGAVPQLLKRLGELKGLSALQYAVDKSRKGASINLRDVPGAIRQVGVEALLVDQYTLEGGTVAEVLKIPFVTVCNGLTLNQEEGVPPPVTSWNYSSDWWTHLRNRLGYAGMSYLAKPVREVVSEYRRHQKLLPYSSDDDFFSKLAIVSQQPSEFEFPRQLLPQCFHFTGPYFNSKSREPVAFPFERLTEQPLIYASLGTIQNGLMWIFHHIAEACAGMDAQLVISLGGSSSFELSQLLPGSPIVVKYAPQLELLQRATLTITHAGLNTVLESLSNGVPMVAIPITYDQPGVAARIAWTGSGEVVPLSKLSIPKLRSAIKRLLTEDSYRQNAFRLQEAIRRSGGVSRAADIVEQVVSTGKPVLSS